MAGDFHVHYAYHTLDLYLVTENWFNIGNGTYIPQPSDLTGSQLLQNYWYQFLLYGNPTKYLNSINGFVSWLPVNSAVGWPNNNTVMLIARTGGGNKKNYRQSFCNYYSYLGISNESYWWSNWGLKLERRKNYLFLKLINYYKVWRRLIY